MLALTSYVPAIIALSLAQVQVSHLDVTPPFCCLFSAVQCSQTNELFHPGMIPVCPIKHLRKHCPEQSCDLCRTSDNDNGCRACQLAKIMSCIDFERFYSRKYKKKMMDSPQMLGISGIPGYGGIPGLTGNPGLSIPQSMLQQLPVHASLAPVGSMQPQEPPQILPPPSMQDTKQPY
jgi:hypothetical protein